MPAWATVVLTLLAATSPLVTIAVQGWTERRRLDHEGKEREKERRHQRFLARDQRSNEVLDRIESAYGDFLVTINKVRCGGGGMIVADAQVLITDSAGRVLLHAENSAISDSVAKLMLNYSPYGGHKPLPNAELEALFRGLEKLLRDDLNARRERWKGSADAPA